MKKFLSCAIVFILVLTMVVPFATMISAADETKGEVILSQEDFKKATPEQLKNYFKDIGWVNGDKVSLGATAISYDTTNDMLLMDMTSCTGITGVNLDVPGIDETQENWMKGMTIEYEMVFVTMGKDFANFCGPYDGGTPNVDYTAYFRSYPKGGNFQIVNWNGDNKVAAGVTLTVKKVAGESIKYRLVCNDKGDLYFYYDANDGEGYQMAYYYENSELHYKTGYYRFALRNKDVFGIKNFSLYKNPVEETSATTEESKTTEATTTSATTTVTTTEATTTTATTAAESGCGSSLAIAGVAIVAATVVPTAVCIRKKRK